MLGGGGVQEQVETGLDDGVAFAGRLLEAGPIQHLHRPAAVADKTRILHRLGAKRDGLSVGAQDLGQEFVGVIPTALDTDRRPVPCAY